jgi:excisionase family DNA binding protein
MVETEGQAKAVEAEPHEVLTVDEAAVFLQVSKQTVRSAAAAGQLPGKKVGKEWRFSRSGLIAWLSEPPSTKGTAPEQTGAE